jgi:DNA-binding MarR family transcriptional regulator
LKESTATSYAAAVVRPGKDALADEAWGLVKAVMISGRDVGFEVAASYGLTPGDLKSLLTLSEDAAPTMSALAEMWTCDASNVTWLVDRLEQGSLVERRPSTTDRRSKTVVLTERGRRARRQLMAAFTTAPAPLRKLSRADLEALCALLRRTGVDRKDMSHLMQMMGPGPRATPS